MRVRVGLVGAAVAALMILVTPPSLAATTRTVTKSYVAGGNDLVVASATGQWATGVNSEKAAACRGVGGVCFGLRPGETTLRLTIVDESGGPSTGAVSFTDRSGRTMPTGWLPFCDTTVVPIPEGAAVAVVTVGAVVSCSFWHPGTTGTITAILR